MGKEISLGPCEEPELCPVSAYQQYLVPCGSEAGLLFQDQGGTPHTNQFWSITSKAMAKLGLTEFAPHSFRIEAASKAAGMGFPPQSIQQLGSWWSGAYRSYGHPIYY